MATQISFGDALTQMQNGNAVRRESWENGVYIIKQLPNSLEDELISQLHSMPDEAKEYLKKQAAAYCNKMYKVYSDRTMDWLPNAEEVYATDWVVWSEE